MASSSGNSSGSNSGQIQNSGSEGDLVDLRKRKRMQSNRESAKRSRKRKQKHLDDLRSLADELRKENSQVLSTMNSTTQKFLNVEAENSVLRAQMTELSQRLQSLDEIVNYLNTKNEMLETVKFQPNSEIFMNDPWNVTYPNQPIMASADMWFPC